jgi:sialic acid synthase SpsE
MTEIRIAERLVGDTHPTYFVADIAANHDGDLSRAVALIRLAAESGADAAKFQHFRAPKIVSKEGFEAMGSQLSHQAQWKKSVFEVYQSASVPWEWTGTLRDACRDAGIHFFSAPYDLEAIDMLAPFVPAFKIGSGDITWIEAVERIAAKGKPVLLATGASELGEVQRAVEAILAVNRDLVLMQCNTNYTASLENFRFVNLRVLQTYRALYPGVLLGLSDHTPGHATVLGAVALGASVIEKHFTDDRTRTGPDHAFSMDPKDWREMVDRARELEAALGSGRKAVEDNERDTVVVQRRCLRAARDLPQGAMLSRADLDPLRPAPLGSLSPAELPRVVGRTLRRALAKGEVIAWIDLG